MNTLAIGAQLGPYKIVALLGSGGMGEVYQARDTRLDRDVALKVLRSITPSDANRNDHLIREARLISTLNHPHIRFIYDTAEFDGVHLIVMEYVEGDTLSQRIERRPLPLAQALTYAQQLASALDAAHSQGVIHRDVKPSNIVVTSRGMKLLDFGIATCRQTMATARDVVDASTQTDSGAVPGTTAYMAPEQLDGSVDDPRSDIFALGVVIYEMLTGRKPFEASSRARMIAAILEHEPAPLSSLEPIPPAIERTVMKCLAKDPLERWQTARDLASELAWLLRTDSGAAASVHTDTSARRRAWMLATAAVVAIAVFVVYATTRTPQANALPAPVRFLAAAPPNSVFTVAAGAFSISPDGRHLAFTASAGGGPRLLWIRALDSFEAHALSGTDDAGFPFWSPDSRTVAFFAGDELKTVDVDGSPLQIVAKIRPSQWGSWGKNGDILFTTVGTGGGGLYRVRASGGTPVQIFSNESTPRVRAGGPEFLPDGEHYLLGVVEPEKALDQVSIYVGSFDNALEQLLVRADSQAIYTDPGYVLYMRAGSLIAHPFDPKTRRTTGEPISIPEPAAFVRAQRRASFSVSQSNVLAYRQGVSTSQLTWFDRSGRRLGTVGAPGRYVNPAIAPDASRIAVTRLAPSLTESDIWLFEPRGERQLTASAGIEDYAVWSPDGQRILHSSNEAGFLDLYVKDAAASAQESSAQILRSNHQKLPMDWTPDGRQVVFSDSAGALNPRLPLVFPIGARGGHPQDLTLARNPAASPRSEDQVQVSPDGRWMAYVSDVSGSAQVYAREFPNGQRRWQVSTDGGFEPKWRGDGREIFYIASDQQMMSVSVTARSQLFEAGRPTPLFRATVLGAPFQNGLVRNEYAVTRDGQRFLINQPIEGPAAYAIRVLVNWQTLLSPATN